MIRFEHLTLRQMINDRAYHSLSEGLVQLPVPDSIRIGRKYYDVPETMEKLSESICYGQRIFLSEKEPNDFGVILRMMDGYYYPIVTGKKWDDDEALKFGKMIMDCIVKDVYPVANHLIHLFAKLTERQSKLLYREPTNDELASGIDKLNKFNELSAIKFLQESLKKTREEVLLTPYNDCLVEFLFAKEQYAYTERLNRRMHPELYKKDK